MATPSDAARHARLDADQLDETLNAAGSSTRVDALLAELAALVRQLFIGGSRRLGLGAV
mgnify:CR=1 FL=1